MTNIYAGGLPDAAGKNLFPSTSSDEAPVQPNSGPNATPTKAGGPPSMNGTYTNQFVDDASYQTGDMSVDSDPKMVIVNPDDLSYS